MPTFHYEGMDNHGEEVSGTLKAADQNAAGGELRGKGYFVTRLKQVCPHCGGPVREFVDRCEDCGKWLTGPEQQPQPELREKALDQAGGEALECKLLELLRAGKKTDAVEIYRKASGLGIAECKACVESLARRHGLPETGPGRFVPAVALLSAVIVATVIAATIAGHFFANTANGGPVLWVAYGVLAAGFVVSVRVFKFARDAGKLHLLRPLACVLFLLAAPLLVMTPFVAVTALGFLGSLVLLGLLLLALAGKSALEHRRQSSWRTTPGVVTVSEVKTLSGVTGKGERKERFFASVQYTYTVDGQQYVGEAVRRFWKQRQDEFETDYDAERVVNRYPVGKSVTVFYNPESPEEAMLQRGVWLGTLALVLLGIAAVALAVYVRVAFP